MDELLAKETADRNRRRCIPLPGSHAGNVCDSFRKADENGNGTIDAEEFAHLIEELNPGMKKTGSRVLFAAADINGDGQLDFAEFMEWIFSDSAEAAEALAREVAARSKAQREVSLRNEEPGDVRSFSAEEAIKAKFSNALRSFLETYPECVEPATKYIEEQKQRLLSPEFAERIGGSFGSCLDKDGNGTLSYHEVKSLISDVLQGDDMTPPEEIYIKEMYGAHCTAAFGNQMGSSQFLDLMRSIRIHLMEKNLVNLEKKWKEEAAQKSMAPRTA